MPIQLSLSLSLSISPLLITPFSIPSLLLYSHCHYHHCHYCHCHQSYSQYLHYYQYSFGPSPSQRMSPAGSKKIPVRKISRIPYKVLDAPALQVRVGLWLGLAPQTLTLTLTLTSSNPNPNLNPNTPALQDDYYLNLVDWSSSNLLSVALGNSVYLWSACNSRVTKLCELEEGDTVTAISWALKGVFNIYS
jgi:hypothetical protein